MPSERITCDCLVVGGGPAGLSAAIAAAEAGLRVVIAECLPSPGRKLLASGSGKCNVTNKLPPPEFAGRFLCGVRFVRPALYGWPPEALREFLAGAGVATVAPDGFHWFPESMRAGDVLEAFLRRIQRFGIRLLPDTPIETLNVAAGRITGAAAPGKLFATGRVILACGGMSYPALGGRGSGYGLARQAGHRIVPPVPALVGLRSPEEWATRLPGVILPDATVRFGKLAGRGELIFTHTGISGPAVLDLSGSVARQLSETPEAVVACSWLNHSTAEAFEWLDALRQQEGAKPVRALLVRQLPSAFVAALCAAAGIPGETPVARLRAADRDRLGVALSAYPLRINATDGWNKAMATAGGVSPGEVHAGTLGSRICGGLYFAGEMLDVGAPCGGYNIQWAASSGRLAGRSAAE